MSSTITNDEEKDISLNLKNQTNIYVMARFRPINTIEKQQCKQNKLPDILPHIDQNTVILKHPVKFNSNSKRSTLRRKNKGKHPTAYRGKLHHIFGINSKQKEVYEIAAEPLINEALKGFNITLLTYGQTGSGKKYSMFGDNKIKHIKYLIFGYIRNVNILIPMDLMNLLILYTNYNEAAEFLYPSNINFDNDTMGILPRALNDIFEKLEIKCNQQTIQTFNVSIQILQIYNEMLLDLIIPKTKSKLQIKTDFCNDSIFVKNLTSIHITSALEGMYALFKGSKNNVIVSSKFSCCNSNKQDILVLLQVTQKCIDGSVLSSQITFGKLHSSENIVRAHKISRKQNENEQRRRREGIGISKCLSALKQCINYLRKGQRPCYRDSVLTHILQDSLGGNTKTLFLICVSPSVYNQNETIRSIRFGEAAKEVINKAKINLKLSRKVLKQKIKKLMVENVKLKMEISVMNGRRDEFEQNKMELNRLLKQEVYDNNVLLKKHKQKSLELDGCEMVVNELKCENNKMIEILDDIASLRKEMEELQDAMKCFLNNSDGGLHFDISDVNVDREDEMNNIHERNQEIGNDIMHSNRAFWSSVFFD